MEPKEQYISYKPSKKFLVRGGISAGIILLALIFQTDWFRALFNKEPKTAITPFSEETIGTLITKDTNGNGIPDWEEKLWGLDPTILYTNGVSNKQIIEQKKKALGVTDTKLAPSNETDLLAQQLFSITSALGQSSQSSEALINIGTDLGNSIEFKDVTNHYSLKDIKTVKTSTVSLKAYFAAMTKVTEQYENETVGIDVLVSALETGDFTRLPELRTTAENYIKFSKSIGAITAPVGITGYHLTLMNGFYGMAQSFDYILEIEDNGVNALAGIAIYRNYGAAVDQAIFDLNDYFIDYGIIKE